MFFGWRCAYPTYTTPTPMLAQRRRASIDYLPGSPVARLFCRAAANALPGLRCVRPAVKLPTSPAETAGA
ncbi:hypothetical protein BJQ76_23610, partial [Klebsiella pneumoniae]|nr:hypothetical protein [Klebsiella pneumoniae]